MQLLRIGNLNEEKPCVSIDGKILDLSNEFNDWDHDFFQNDGLKKLQKILNEKSFEEVAPGQRIGSCITRPHKVICVGLNYFDHAKEAGMDVPEEPILFMKASNTFSGPNDDVLIPPGSVKSDWEVELGIVIEKECSYLKTEEEAANVIAGYCVSNDVSEREWQLEHSGQWTKGKSFKSFNPTGPKLVTRDEIPDPINLKMELWINGEQKQNGNTSTMIFKPFEIVKYLSNVMTLEAGDLISTGTPPGVGMGFKPQQFLKHGDEIVLEIEHLGRQTQKCV